LLETARGPLALVILWLAWWVADQLATVSVYEGGLVYGAADGQELLLDVLRSEASSSEPKPLVVYLHGGGWHEGDRGAAMHPWLNRVSTAMDQRLALVSRGPMVPESGTVSGADQSSGEAKRPFSA